MKPDVSLIVKTHAFGDALLCTPAVKALIAEGGKWIVLTGTSAVSVWKRMPGIEKVFIAPFPPSSVSDYAKLFLWSIRNRKKFRNVKQSYVFQASPAVRRWIRFLTGGAVKSIGEKSLKAWDRTYPAVPGEYIGATYARLADIEQKANRPLFDITPVDVKWAENLGIAEPYAVFAVGGGINPRDTVLEKRWQTDKYAEIVRRTVSEGCNIVLMGGPGDIEVTAELERLAGVEVLNLVGKTTWGQSSAVLSRCRCFIGNDSGTSHLATAVGIQAVVIFGPTAPEDLYSLGLIEPVVSGASCSPCYANMIFPGCRQSSVRCMEEIDIDKTWNVLRGVIHEDNSS